MSSTNTMQMEPITVTNVLNKTSMELSVYLSCTIYAVKVPILTANTRPEIEANIAPLLGYFANYHSYCYELYGICQSSFFQSKSKKKSKSPDHSDTQQYDLEAKVDILYRAAQVMELNYQACSRIMTALGAPDARSSRHT